jgi:hypothetical protein
LEINTDYHFRFVAENTEGISYGDDLEFTTVCPSLVPTLTGPGAACISSSYTYFTESGMIGYEWNVSPGGQIISGDGTNTVSILWSSAGEQSVNVTYSNLSGCPATSPASMEVTVYLLPEPAIDGNNIVCVKSSLNVYTTQPGFNDYFWSVSQGGTIVSGQGTYQVEINWDLAGDNNVQVSYTGPAGCPANSPANFEVDVLPYPGNAGPISGTPVLCAGSRSVSYSVEPVPDVIEYVWSLPSGANIMDGEFTPNIVVNFNQDAESGLITVYGVNNCGEGQSSPPFQVTVNPVPPAPVVTLDEYFILHSDSPEGNQWYFNNTLIEGANGQEYQAEENGMYYDIVTLDGCPSGISNPVEVIMTGIAEFSKPELDIFPVPNNGKFTVSISATKEETYSLQVYNAIGIKIYELNDIHVTGKIQQTISLENPSSGVYTVVLTGKGTVTRKKILVSG